jgi:hypothetical protein
MKILIKLFLGLIILIILFFGALLVFANPLLERVKPQILAAVSSAIDAQVEAEEIRAGVFPWPNFSLRGLLIDNKDGDDLKLQELSLEIALAPLFSKKVEVTSVTVKGVQVPIEKLSNGEIEVAGINFAKKAEEKKKEATEVASKGKPAEKDAGTPLDIKISRASISDVSVSFRDIATGAVLTVNDVIIDLARNGTETSFTAKIIAGKDLISGTGSFSDTTAQKNIPLFNADLTFSIDSLVPYLAFAPDVDPKGLPQAGAIPGTISVKHVKGAGDVSVMDVDLGLTFAGQGITSKTVVTDIEKPQIRSDVRFPSLVLQPLLDIFVPENTPQYAGGFRNLSCTVESPDIEKRISFHCGSDAEEIESVMVAIPSLRGRLDKSREVQEFQLEEGKLSIGEGEIALKASSKSTQAVKENRFAADVAVSRIEIANLVKLAPKEHRDQKITGVLSDITASVTGVAGKKETTSGTFNAQIDDLVLHGYNFMKDLFSTLDAVPGVGLQIEEAVPASHRRIITSEDTRLEKLSAKGSIAGETLSLESFLADGEGFQVKGSGTLSAENVDLDVQAVLEKELVEAIQERKPKIERFKESDGTVVFPVTVRKRGDNKPVITPDVNRLMKQQAGEEIKRKAEKALDKVKPGLGGLFKR